MKHDKINTLEKAKKKFHHSLMLLALAVIYLISPFDFIPGIAPFEWIEDIPMLILSVIYSAYTYFRMKSTHYPEEL